MYGTFSSTNVVCTITDGSRSLATEGRSSTLGPSVIVVSQHYCPLHSTFLGAITLPNPSLCVPNRDLLITEPIDMLSDQCQHDLSPVDQEFNAKYRDIM